MTLPKNISKKESNLLGYILLFFVLIFTIETVSFLFLIKGAIVTIYIKLLSFCILTYSLITFYKWNKNDKIILIIFFAFLIKLIIESIIYYGSLLVYPSVFSVLFPVLYVIAVKNIFKASHINILDVLCKTIIAFYIIFMIFNIGKFGLNLSNNVFMENMDELGPYSGDARVLHARSIYLLMLPYLFYLNSVIKKANLLNITIFCFLLLAIIIHQHRTVWVTTIVSTFLLLTINNKIFLRVLLISALSIVALFLLIVFIPNLKDLFIDRFQDILDPFNENNTSGWRYVQILSYFDYVIEKPFFGWGMNGFNLPNPFIDFWEEGTGHHFHDAYIEVLFYFGIAGLLLKYYPIYKSAKYLSEKKISDNTKVLIIFCVSGFIFSFSYVPPLTFWGIVGVCLLYIDKDFKLIRKTKQLCQN